MPQVVEYKVRAEVEFTVVSVKGYGAASKWVEDKITPVVKRDEDCDLDGSYAREARIVRIDAQFHA